MAFGLCCHYLVERNGKQENLLSSKVLQLGKFNAGGYTDEDVRGVYEHNTATLLRGFEHVVRDGIKSFRLSSSLFPLFDKVGEHVYTSPKIVENLRAFGAMARANGVRVTTHPGQFVVLSSDRRAVIDSAIVELNFHGWVFDVCGFDRSPYYSINIHGGKRGRTSTLISSIALLDDASRKRLTLENCEFAYSVADLLPVSRETGVPICFDSHHHAVSGDATPGADALAQAIATWGPIKPNTHVSNTADEYVGSNLRSKLRQHSDYIRTVPEYQLRSHNDGAIDIDVEAKAKNLAIARLELSVGSRHLPTGECSSR